MTSEKEPDLNDFMAQSVQQQEDPAEITEEEKLKKALKERDPTRYGDWEFKGRCIDF